MILTFHGLGEPRDTVASSERRVWIPYKWFQAIIDAPLHHEVSLAFDDGNASDIELALPMLASRGLTARFFPVAGRIGREGYLGADEIGGLSAAGMIIGSQGMHHRDWRTLSAHELREELNVSRRMLAEIVGDDITEVACPFGCYDRRVLRVLRDGGYQRVFNSDGSTGPAGAWLMPRTTVNQCRPLEHWLELAKAGARGRPSPVQLGKRLIKRMR